jgi:hypothetical protein
MKILVCTFGEGDHMKALDAMRRLPYERLVLVGEPGLADTDSLARIRTFEELSGHDVETEIIYGDGFMDEVDQISEVLEKHSMDPSSGERNSVILNISGGRKLLGDAALFAAFRLGVRACHCDGRMTMLPVVNGATATDRFTPAQSKFLMALGADFRPLDEMVSDETAPSRQAAERVIRQLRKLDLLKTVVKGGKIHVALSDAGLEVSHALRRSSFG